MPKGQRKYNGAQKVEIIKQLHNEKLSFYEASSKYGIPRRTLQDWERIYLEEGEEALLVERRGRACAASGTQKGRKPKLDKQIEEDLIAENQRLRMEIDYLKKLNALVLNCTPFVRQYGILFRKWGVFVYRLLQQPPNQIKTKRPEPCAIQDSDRSGRLILIFV